MYFSLFMVVLRTLNTIAECLAPDTCHGVGDVDGRQARATKECLVPDSCHGASGSVVHNRLRDGDAARITVYTKYVRDFSRFGLLINLVPNAINLHEILRPRKHGDEHKKECK